MNTEERIAKKYLENIGFDHIVFEPDKNETPDFVINQEKAIEVRRLNRIVSPNTMVAEENIYKPFGNRIKKAIESFNGLQNNKSYLIIIDYKSPCLLPKISKKKICAKLKSFLDSKNKELPYSLFFGDSIELRFFEWEFIKGCTFISARMHFPVGCITNLYIENIHYCIEEKSRKIEIHRHKYPDWHLLLVDTMRWDLDDSEIEKIKRSIKTLGLFNSLTVISYEAKLIFCV